MDATLTTSTNVNTTANLQTTDQQSMDTTELQTTTGPLSRPPSPTLSISSSSSSTSSADSQASSTSGTNAAIADDEVDLMLDSSLVKKRQSTHIEKKKIVMKKRGQDYFEVLPEGWIEVTHFSGMPLYLHKQSRVCTLAKPYYLGTGSARKHEVPISAIPCLQYRKEIEKEKNGDSEDENRIDEDEESHDTISGANVGGSTTEKCPKVESNPMQPINESTATKVNSNEMHRPPLEAALEDGEIPDSPVKSVNCPSIVNKFLASQNCAQASNSGGSQTSEPVIAPAIKPVARVETVLDHRRKKSLNYTDLREYCKSLFEFREITIRKFKTWSDRRKHNLELRKQKQRPSLPGDTKLITCSLTTNDQDSNSNGTRKEFIMNPAGKSWVCILHEFVQHKEKVQPKYVYKELENASSPYSATVIIKDMEYGVGYGSSKKLAKLEAARATVEILIPDMKTMMPDKTNKSGTIDSTHDLKFFENIKIEDSRVSELCAKAGQQSPFQILNECLRRNSGMTETDIEHDVKMVRHQKNEYFMRVGEHSVRVPCKNKREGKQRAAQAILQLMHPQVTSWAGLLKMYGRGSCKTPREKKEEEQKITELQSMASPNKPNYQILNKLREEMLKLRQP